MKEGSHSKAEVAYNGSGGGGGGCLWVGQEVQKKRNRVSHFLFNKNNRNNNNNNSNNTNNNSNDTTLTAITTH